MADIDKPRPTETQIMAALELGFAKTAEIRANAGGRPRRLHERTPQLPQTQQQGNLCRYNAIAGRAGRDHRRQKRARSRQIRRRYNKMASNKEYYLYIDC